MPGAAVAGSCHCGAVGIGVARPPVEIRHCNCGLCRRYGALWAYYPIAEVTLLPDPPPTATYAWNGRNVDFHRCRSCGCLVGALRDDAEVRLAPFEAIGFPLDALWTDPPA